MNFNTLSDVVTNPGSWYIVVLWLFLSLVIRWCLP
jgi:hypothetical protein